jgi:hypothetical protein
MKRLSLHLKSQAAILTLTLIIFSNSANAQHDSDSAFPQFLFPGFSQATLKMKDGNSQVLEMNYNKVSGKMVFKRNGKPYDLLNPEVVDTVYLQNVKFVRFGQAFYEEIFAAPVSLFLNHKGSLVSTGKPSGYGTTSQTSSISSLSGISTDNGYYNLELPPEFTVKDDPVYWIRKNNDWFSFTNIKQFLKIFPDKENDLKEFIKNNHIKIDRRDDLINLMSYCNKIITGF